MNLIATLIKYAGCGNKGRLKRGAYQVKISWFHSSREKETMVLLSSPGSKASPVVIEFTFRVTLKD